MPQRKEPNVDNYRDGAMIHAIAYAVKFRSGAARISSPLHEAQTLQRKDAESQRVDKTGLMGNLHLIAKSGGKPMFLIQALADQVRAVALCRPLLMALNGLSNETLRLIQRWCT